MNVRDTTLWGADGIPIPPSLLDRLNKVVHFEDFEGAVLNVTDGKWKSNTVQTGGTPTVALVADTANGEVACSLDATNEVQRAELYWGDMLNIDIAKNPVLRARVKFSTIAVNEFVVVGLATARNTTYDSIATHVWFRLDADMDILIEGDDGATDTDDIDTGINAFNGTYLQLEIDCSDLSAVKFKIDGTEVSTEIAIAAATGTVQPFVGVGKASGTGTPSLTVDFLEVEWDR